MASLADIRAGLVANLEAALTGMQINAYTLSNPSPPCVEIDLSSEGMTFDHASNRGVVELPMIVRVVLADGSDYGAQVSLDSFIDGASGSDVKAAIESDPTLGGVAHTLQVTEVVPRRWKSDTTGGLLVGAEWQVMVYASGTS